jgi:hypothetical protein
MLTEENMGSRIGWWILAISCILGVAVATESAPPQDATYQGLLLDSLGDPLAGPVNIEIGVWDQPTGGTQLYGETHSGVSLEDGVFNLLLGTGSVLVGSFDANLFASQNRYLEVIVNTEVLIPRQPFSSVAYSLRSEESEAAAFAATAGDADTVDGSHAASLDQSAHVSDTANPHGVTAAQAGAATTDEISTAVSTHASDAGAHHGKTTSFGELTDAATDAQIPATMARDSEVFGLVLASDGSGSGLSSDYLDGWSSSSFLRSNASDSYTSGTLTMNSGTALVVGGTLRVDNGTSDEIAFDTGSELMSWDGAQSRFELTDDLATSGALRVGGTSATMDSYNAFAQAAAASPDSADMSNTGDIYVQNDVEVGGQLYLSRDIYMEGDSGTGADGDQSIHFYNANSRGSEHIAWNDFEGIFDLSASTRVQGNLIVDGDLSVAPESIEKEDLAPSAATLLPVAFGHVESPSGTSSYSYHTTGTTVLGFDGDMLEIEPPTGCDATGDCIIIVTQAGTYYQQVPSATDQVSSHGRFGIVVRGLTVGTTANIPSDPFDVNFVIYKFP